MSVGAPEGLALPTEAPGCGTSARPSGRVEDCSVVGAVGVGMFGVGTTEGMVVGGMSGGPSGARAGAKGAAVVTTDGAGASGRLGVATGRPNGTGADASDPGGARKKALARPAIIRGSKGAGA